MKVIGTGGLANLFRHSTHVIEQIDGELTIRGFATSTSATLTRPAKPTGRPQRMSADELVFLPLGGAGEIGMNLNLYGFGPSGAWKWIAVDLGITFGDEATPGVDVVMRMSASSPIAGAISSA